MKVIIQGPDGNFRKETMQTTRADLEEWFKQGLKKKATHMIIACDTFDNSDYPVYVKNNENVIERVNDYSKPEKMSIVVEVYNLSMDMNKQLNEYRSFNY